MDRARMLIALPSIEDLEREASRTGQRMRLEQSRRSYISAMHQIEQAHLRMAYAALAIVRPDDFRRIDGQRRMLIQEANHQARLDAKSFFTDECIGLRSEQ